MGQICIIYQESNTVINSRGQTHYIKSEIIDSFELLTDIHLVKEVKVLVIRFSYNEKIDFHQTVTRKESRNIHIRYLQVDGVVLFGELK